MKNLKDFTPEEQAYFDSVETINEDRPMTEDELLELKANRDEALNASAKYRTFDLQAHAASKSIGNNVGEVDVYARGRQQSIENCPLMAKAAQNSRDAEKRLKQAKGKTYPEESKPEDQYKHLDLSAELVKEALDEFLEEAKDDFSSKESERLERGKLFSKGPASEQMSALRHGVRACVYCHISNSRAKASSLFDASSLDGFPDAFLYWFYNYQHYPSGDVHIYFSDLHAKFLEKTLA